MANFQILEPVQDGPGDVDGADSVRVRLDDPNGSRFEIKVFLFDDLMGEGSETGSMNFNNTANPAVQVNVRVAAGSVAATAVNNRAIQVRDLTKGVADGHPFRAIPFVGSGSAPEPKPEQILFKVCRTDQPIPAKLSLKLDSALTKGACSNINELNRAITLTFSAEGPVIGKWLSKPINLGEKKPGLPAYWVLEKKTVKTWVLTLRQGKKALVTYAFNTEVAKDCSFPIQPALKSAGGKHFKKWPKTVTIKPAR